MKGAVVSRGSSTPKSRSFQLFSRRFGLATVWRALEGSVEHVAEGEVDAREVLLEPSVIVFAVKLPEPLEEELLLLLIAF